MTERLTASAAREIADQQKQQLDKTVDEALTHILTRVNDAAERGEYHARITAYGFADTRLYTDSTLTTEQLAIIDQFDHLGYTAKNRRRRKTMY